MLRLQNAKPFGGGSKADDALWGKLLLSYDALGIDEQQMFLDIACILLGRRAHYCLPVWGPLADSTVQNLKNRSLVSVNRQGCLAVHDQLHDMGQAIVKEQHKKIGQRLHVWMPDAQELIRSRQASFLP